MEISDFETWRRLGFHVSIVLAWWSAHGIRNGVDTKWRPHIILASRAPQCDLQQTLTRIKTYLMPSERGCDPLGSFLAHPPDVTRGLLQIWLDDLANNPLDELGVLFCNFDHRKACDQGFCCPACVTLQRQRHLQPPKLRHGCNPFKQENETRLISLAWFEACHGPHVTACVGNVPIVQPTPG